MLEASPVVRQTCHQSCPPIGLSISLQGDGEMRKVFVKKLEDVAVCSPVQDFQELINTLHAPPLAYATHLLPATPDEAEDGPKICSAPFTSVHCLCPSNWVELRQCPCSSLDFSLTYLGIDSLSIYLPNPEGLVQNFYARLAGSQWLPRTDGC